MGKKREPPRGERTPAAVDEVCGRTDSRPPDSANALIGQVQFLKLRAASAIEAGDAATAGRLLRLLDGQLNRRLRMSLLDLGPAQQRERAELAAALLSGGGR